MKGIKHLRTRGVIFSFCRHLHPLARPPAQTHVGTHARTCVLANAGPCLAFPSGHVAFSNFSSWLKMKPCM